MFDQELFFSMNPAEPWSFYPLGVPAFLGVAAGLVLFTLWTYRGRAAGSRGRIALVVALRLAALVVALLTALRPSVGVQEDPKVPSTLLIGIDMSESMTVPDELGQERIKAVRKVLEKCEPTIEELKAEQNVNVEFYGFGLPEFNDAGFKYDPKAPAKFNRSDYGSYLNRTFDRWQSERFVRGHIVVGDGIDNGSAFAATAEAERWRRAGRPIHTFAVGRTDTDSGAKDVAITSVSVATGNPDGSVFVKTEFTLKVIVKALGFKDATVPIVVSFARGDDKYKVELTQDVKLANEKENEIDLKLTAPEVPGEIKVKIEIPFERTPGDVAPSNNVIETYLLVTKEGMRVLIVNRLGFEHAAIRRALQADPRISLFQVIRQTEDPATPEEREDFDFDKRAYDVIIIGNVSAKQLTSLDPELPAKLRDQVLKKGVGLLMTGGHATFLGTPGIDDASGWRGTKAIEDILPVDLAKSPPVLDTVFTSDTNRFQYLPTFEQREHYLNRLGNTPAESADLWRKLNDLFANRARFTGLSKMGAASPTATVFAVASERTDTSPVPTQAGEQLKLAPLLVGHQIGAGSRGRVLALAAQDTYLWQKLGQPKTNDGLQLHARFWRQLVRWLAHQEEDDAAAFAKPDLRRLPVGGKQSIRVGLRTAGGVPAKDPKFELKVIPPGTDEAAAKTLTPIPDPDGGFKVPYDPAVAGEFNVKLVATGKDAEGKDVKGEATARFLAYDEASDEMLKKAADHDFLQKLAAAGGGKFQRLEDLPAFLKELKAEKIETVKPKPKFRPDWRRAHSEGFLPFWLMLFVLLLGTEWGLRRWWGLV